MLNLNVHEKRANGYLAGAIAVLMCLVGCGQAASHSGSDAGSQETAVSLSGDSIEDDCGRFVADHLIREYVDMNYSVAVASITALGATVSVETDGNETVFTPVEVKIARTLTKSALPATTTIYVHGGQATGHTTHARGPEGVVPGQEAIIIAHPEGDNQGAPGVLVENALPLRGTAAFLNDACWSVDGIPEAIPTQASVARLQDGRSVAGPTTRGAAVPLALIERWIASAEAN